MAEAANAETPPVLLAAQLPETQTPTDPSAIVDGTLDSAFLSQPSQRLSVSPSSDFWYRLTLSADWKAAQPPVVSFQDARGGRTDVSIWVYAPPDYYPNLLRIGINSGLTWNAPTVLLPDNLRADQVIYVRIGEHRSRTEVIAMLDDLSGFLAKDRNDIRLVTAFVSVQAAMLLIGLFLWLLLRDRLSLHFFLGIFSHNFYTAC